MLGVRRVWPLTHQFRRSSVNEKSVLSGDAGFKLAFYFQLGREQYPKLVASWERFCNHSGTMSPKGILQNNARIRQDPIVEVAKSSNLGGIYP